jgi:hypothetical protein
MGTITKASHEALAAECAEWHKRALAAEATNARVRELEAALRKVRDEYVGTEYYEVSTIVEVDALLSTAPDAAGGTTAKKA